MNWNKLNKKEKLKILNSGGYSDKYIYYKHRELTTSIKELIKNKIRN